MRLAVVAHIRHAETSYDTVVAQGRDRRDARAGVEIQVRAVLAEWKRQE